MSSSDRPLKWNICRLPCKPRVIGMGICGIPCPAGRVPYELVEEVSQVIDVNEGTIYPLLKRLTNEHYFETYLRESSEGPPRKYYHLTAAGILYRDSLAAEWEDFQKREGRSLQKKKKPFRFSSETAILFSLTPQVI